VRLDHRPIDCRHDQHRKGSPLKLLLVLHILVTGQKYVKAFAIDQLKKGPVFNSAPLHSDHSVYLMLGQGRASFPGTSSSNKIFKAEPGIGAPRGS
jgi:hypothetical protein